MIETPSAAFIADLLAAECDFLSIGTNDLIQYSLAADRDDEHVGYLYHPLHPAILRALKQIVQGATRAGKPVAMCGDMAGDPMLSGCCVGLGLREPLDGAAPDAGAQVDHPFDAAVRRRAHAGRRRWRCAPRRRSRPWCTARCASAFRWK